MADFSRLFQKIGRLPAMSKADTEAAMDIARSMGRSGEEALEEAAYLARQQELEDALSALKMPQVRASTDPALSEVRDLAVRGSTDLAPIPSRISKPDINIEDAVVLEEGALKNPTRSLKKLAIPAGAAAIGGAALLGGGGEELPVTEEMPKISQETAPEHSKAQVQEPRNTRALITEALTRRSPERPLNNLESIDFGDNTIASVEALREAQDRANMAEFINRLGAAGERMSAALAGVKGDQTPFLQQAQASKAIPENYLKQVQFEKEDPNSAVSKGYREILKKMGFDIQGQASASDLERLYPSLANIFSSREARAARQDEMKLRAQDKAEAQSEKETQKQEARKDKFIEAAQKQLSKEFEKVQTLETAFANLEAAKGDKTGPGDVAILYNFIKSMDPTSVVREGEIALGQRGMSLAGQIYAMTRGKFTGEMLSPGFRKDVLTIARRLRDKGLDSYSQAAATLRDTATQRYGFSEDELTLIDPMLNRQKKKEQAQTAAPSKKEESSNKVVVKKGYNPKTDQTQLIYSDGSKEIVKGRR